MLLYRVDDLTSGDWPKDLQKRAQRLFDELREGIVAFTKNSLEKLRPNISTEQFLPFMMLLSEY